MEEITLQNVGGKILASSREVAERFGKQNKHVNESIKKLMVENSTVKNMFTKDEYKSNRGRMETEVKESVYETPYGTKTQTTTKVTGKGQIYITEKLRKELKVA